MTKLQIANARSAAGAQILRGNRPVLNEETGEVGHFGPGEMFFNSQLRKDEWESLDAAVVQAARIGLVLVDDIISAGLTKQESLGVMTSQWNEVSEFAAATVNMSGRTRPDQDRLDYDLTGVPLPVISKAFSIGARELEASRKLGSSLDTGHAFAAARVVAEKLEDMAIDGDSLSFQGNTIYGITNHPSRNTDTATNYGGGDWGTIANVTSTVAGMINAANADRFYGPFNVYVATTQYNQAALEYYTDGSGQTPLQRILAMPQVSAVKELPKLAAGEVVLVQMTPDVLDLAWVPAYFNTAIEWMSPNGFESHFQIVTVATPRVKADYNGRSGIVHATGA